MIAGTPAISVAGTLALNAVESLEEKEGKELNEEKEKMLVFKTLQRNSEEIILWLFSVFPDIAYHVDWNSWDYFCLH